MLAGRECCRDVSRRAFAIARGEDELVRRGLLCIELIAHKRFTRHQQVLRGAKVRRAILDKNVRVPEGALIGYDSARDRQLYHVTESGIVVVEGRRSRVEIASMEI